MAFDRSSGSKGMVRLEVRVNDNGMKMHDYGHGAEVLCRAGWNDGCPMVALTMSVDELRDLRYLLERAIAAADAGR